MFNRFCFGVLLLAGLALPFTGCDTSTGLDSITVSPATAAMTVGGATLQLTAVGTFGNGSKPTSGPVSAVTWTSSPTTVATVDPSTGVVTAVSAGTATITATANGFNGPVTATATITVTGGSNSGSGSTTGNSQEALQSIQIVPGGITVSNKGMTGQFLAFGTFSVAPYVRDLTNQVTWISDAPEVATIDSTGATGEQGGLATAMGYTGDAVIYAEATNPDGTIVLSNPETFTCKDQSGVCEPDVPTPLLATLTVYNAGENTTTWLVTAPSDTGIPNLIHCGGSVEQASTGGSVCTGTYAVGSPVTLTESPTGTGFGGWSSNCPSMTGVTGPPYPSTCTFTLNGDTSVGAIFY